MQGKEWHNLSKVFTFADENSDFKKLKQQGVKAVLIKYSPKIRKTVKSASSFGMRVMVEMTSSTKDNISVIKPLAGRVYIEEGSIDYISTNDIKDVIKKLGKGISDVMGFVLPIPAVNGLLWNDEIRELINAEIDDLYDLFDEEKEISHIRWQYFTSVQKYLYETYMLPQKELLKGSGKKTVFYIGEKELEYDLVENLVNTKVLKHKGLNLGICCDKDLAETEFGLCGGDFVFDENGCEQIHQKRTSKDILLIKPNRGVVERYVETGRRNRIETSALSSAVEGVFWGEKLKLKGYSFDVMDESSFYKKRDFEKYKDVLICDSCLFTDKELTKINRILDQGIRINSAELMTELLKQGEEEWEK